jgi:hypothetical protein
MKFEFQLWPRGDSRRTSSREILAMLGIRTIGRPGSAGRLCFSGVRPWIGADAKVLSCYDGDTCRLEREILPGRDRIRLANADTPEIEGRCQEESEPGNHGARLHPRPCRRQKSSPLWL